ncbi:probable multidrug resistance-associated protein lethal(2)03659 isoform X3 [Agrilus planipennis]|nr:probable multidrug resistance-associated protein lethal(2)03659 isoform X3 [Agrilus planipennis]
MLKYFEPFNKNNTNPPRFPMYLNRIFNYWTSNQSPIQKSEMYFFASGIIVTSFLPTIILHPYMMGVTHLGMKIRIACSSLIYRKALRIDIAALGGETVGHCVNLLAIDVNKFDITPLFFHYIWVSPLQTLLCFYCLWREIKIAAAIGMISIAIFIPIQVIFAFKIIKFRAQTAVQTDERLRHTNEFIQGMQVLKMYAWEYPLAKLIHKIRSEEMKYLKPASYIRGLFMSFILFTTRLGIFLSCMSHVMYGGKLTASKMFFIVAHYFILRQTMTVYFPQGVAQVAEAYVSIKRIEAFMKIHETSIGDPSVLDPKNTQAIFRSVTPNDLLSVGALLQKGVFMNNIIVKYGDYVCINDLTANIVPGQLTAVIGPIGAGKSALLNTILGELIPSFGDIKVNGIVSYASQEAWLFSGSVRANILFGEYFDRIRYREVVTVCTLIRDFTLLPFGDRTIVGERGASLSGGQRARVNLARAVYKKADIYLLDDPLSAVDPNVALQLFTNCITGYLKSKAVVLVTHQLQFLQSAQQVIVMEDGNILGRGTYNELESSGINFTRLLHTTPVPVTETYSEPPEPRLQPRSLSLVGKQSSTIIPEEVDEIRTYGKMGSYVYKEYIKSGGNCCVILIVTLMFLFTQFFASGCDLFVAKWAQLEEKRASLGTAESLGFWNVLTRKDCILVFFILIMGDATFAISRSFIFYSVCIRAAVRLHDRMFSSILHAKMTFFHTNPSGRILNRFSKDIGAIDEALPSSLIDTIQICLNLVGAVIVIGVCHYLLIIPTVLVIVMFIALRNYYLRTSRSVKRLDAITRSPIFTHINATIQGLITVRSEGKESILLEEFDELQDIQSSAYFYFLSTSRAFGYWLDIICCCYITTVTLFYTFTEIEGEGPSTGLAITQAIGLIGVFQWGMRQSAEVESHMTSVERVLEFIYEVEQEPPLESTPDQKPPPSWPKYGKLEFQNFSLRYDVVGSPVLNNLNITIHPREKVGIVGRTGAGKSTLISSLFRLGYESGLLLIDGIDISKMGLHDLRKKISIIPQEPVLFSGTLRYNLDPFDEYHDGLLVAALVDVEIKVAVINGAACLKLIISEGGQNLSVGQRQLICLARAIVRNNKILVMDEATANVDPTTDFLIQQTIRTKFKHCTVLTIAHRLATVMDSDRILVLDAGNVVEFDHPHILLQNSDGLLSQLVLKTGTSMAKQLKKTAEKSYSQAKSDTYEGDDEMDLDQSNSRKQ